MIYIKFAIALPLTFFGLFFWVNVLLPNTAQVAGAITALVAAIFSVSYSLMKKIY